MRLARITPPTEEPLTVADLVAHLRLDDDAESDLLGVLIQAAREHAEDFTRRAIMSSGWRMTLDGFPCSDEIELPRPNLLAVTAFTYQATDGTSTPVPASLYTVDRDGLPGRLFLNYSKFWPSTLSIRNAVTIEFTAGYESAALVPAAIKAAIKLLAAHLYENREATISGTIIAELPLGAKHLLWPYRFLGGV